MKYLILISTAIAAAACAQPTNTQAISLMISSERVAQTGNLACDTVIVRAGIDYNGNGELEYWEWDTVKTYCDDDLGPRTPKAADPAECPKKGDKK